MTALLCVALGGLSALTLKHGHSSLSDTSSPPSTPPSAILVNLFNFLLLCSSHHLTQSQHNPHSVCPSREHSSHLHRCSSRVPRWCPQTTALCHLWYIPTCGDEDPTHGAAGCRAQLQLKHAGPPRGDSSGLAVWNERFDGGFLSQFQVWLNQV